MLKAAFKLAKIPNKLLVYRRVSEYQFFDKEVNLRSVTDKKIDRDLFVQIIQDFTDKKFTQGSFLSTSLVRDQHQSYNGIRYPILLKISIPKGTRAIYVDEISNHYGQNELLLDRGYIFQYKDFKIIKEEYGESIVANVFLVRSDE